MLLTRAPVAGGRVAAPPLPLDLHVLGLSLAFILSQDQTLRCLFFIFFFSFCSLFFLLFLRFPGRAARGRHARRGPLSGFSLYLSLSRPPPPAAGRLQHHFNVLSPASKAGLQS